MFNGALCKSISKNVLQLIFFKKTPDTLTTGLKSEEDTTFLLICENLKEFPRTIEYLITISPETFLCKHFRSFS